MDKTNSLNELLTVVDENDNVVGSALRVLVHGQPPLKHREVAILVYDKNRKVLIQQRSKNKIQRPLVWTVSVTGHVGAGVSPDQAAVLELREELGLTGDLKFTYKQYSERENNHKFLYRYICEYSGEEIRMEKEEIEQIKFIDEKELDEMINNGEKISDLTITFLREFWAKRQ